MTKSTESSSLPPRPLNCFLLYRIDKQKEIVAKCEGANHRDISKIIAKWWKEATDEEKLPYVKKAQEEKKKHAKLYPDYKYSPKKKIIPKRVYKRKTNSSFTSRKEENNRIMELIYEDSTSLEKLDEAAIPNESCAKMAQCSRTFEVNIKIEHVESPKQCYSTDDDLSPFADDASSFSAKSYSPVSCFSPELSWKSSPYSNQCAMVSDVDPPRLSFSTRIPLNAFSPVSYPLSSPIAESMTSCSTPSAVFSPTSYNIEPPAFQFDSQQQIYDSSSLNGLSTPINLTSNDSYFVDLTDINDQYSNNFIYNSTCQYGLSLDLGSNFEYRNVYSQFESNNLPQYIDPSFIMKC